MSTYLRLIPLLAAAYLLAACSLLMPKPEDLRPPLANPADFDRTDQQFTQIVSQADDPAKAMLASWRVSDGELVLVGLTATGQQLFQASYDGNQLQIQQSPLLPPQVDTETILAQIQLAYWPQQSLEQAYSGSNWSLRTVSAGRRLYYDSHLVFEVIPKKFISDAAGRFCTQLVIDIPDLQQQIAIDTLNMDQ